MQTLNLYDSPLCNEEASRALFSSAHLAGLRGLYLGEGDATPGMVSILAERLFGLRELYLWDFHQGELGDEGLTLLANSPAFASLRTLDLLQTGVRAEGARAVAESPHLRQLESLSFGFQACGYAPNYIGPEGVRHLARSPQLAGLRTLRLGLTRAGTAGVCELVKSPHLCRLKTLDLGLNELQDDAAVALAEWPGMATVAWLNLSSNKIGSKGVAALANSVYVAKLEALGLSMMPEIGEAGLLALAASPHLHRLRQLWLWGQGYSEAAIAILLGENRFAQLTALSIGGLNETQRARLKAHFGDRVSC